MTSASATRTIKAPGHVVLRVAQTVQLRDVVGVAPVPGPLRRLVARVFRRSWDRGLFAIVMALGFSVRETIPLRSLTLTRPLGETLGWQSGPPANALRVRLAVAARDDRTDVSVCVDVHPAHTFRGRAARGGLRLLRPVVSWALGLWLAGLDERIAAPRG